MIRLRNITKTFPSVVALRNVSIDLNPGEIHSILGSNGAGKSTLAWLLAGRFNDYTGDAYFEGRRTDIRSRRASINLGIQIAPQEPALAPDLTIEQNVRVALPGSSSAYADRLRRLYDLFEHLGLTLPKRVRVGDLDLATKQFISIFRALAMAPSLLILDEPPLLSDSQETMFFENLLPLLRSEGIGIVLITHQIDKALTISDFVSIMRQAELVKTVPSSQCSESEIKGFMYPNVKNGRAQISETGSHAHPGTEFTFTVGDHRSIGVRVTPGQVTSLTSEPPQIAAECLRSIVGLSQHARVSLGPSYLSPQSACDAGVVFLSSNREREGVFPDLTVQQNILLGVVQAKFWHSSSQYASLAEQTAKQLGLDQSRKDHFLRQLSGGNQQRVLMSRSRMAKPKLCLLEEPDRGIDVASLQLIAGTIRELSSNGSAVLMTSLNSTFIQMVSDHVMYVSQCPERLGR